MLQTLYRDIKDFKALVAAADRAGVKDPAAEAAREYLIATKRAIEVLHRELQTV